MKITIITPFFPFPKRGNAHGAERYAENLAIHLKKQGHDIKVVTTYWNGGKRYNNYNGIPILKIFDSKTLLGKYGSVFFLDYITFGLNLFRKKNFNFYKNSDILIFDIAIPFTRFFKTKKIPIISVFFHLDITMNDFIFDRFFLTSLHFLERNQFRKNNNIIAISESTKKDLIDYYRIDPRKITVIPIGIDTKKFNPSNFSSNIKKIYGNNILLYSALTVHRKRVPILLKAMTYVIKKIPDAHLILTGGGPLWNDCIQLAKSLGLQKHTTFLGFVKDDELLEYFASTDIFVLPSEKEGFGQVLLESMASGTPIICANKPPMSEIVENGGLTFKLNDPIDLANKIIELLSNRKKLNDLKSNSLKIVKKYEWPYIAKIYDNYFRKIRKL